MTDILPLAIYLFIYGGGVITWSSKKQAVVALSTTEAEYIALSAAAQEAAWLQKLLLDLRMPPQPLIIMEDNQGAIALANNPIGHSRTKHIDIRFHFIRESNEKGLIIDKIFFFSFNMTHVTT